MSTIDRLKKVVSEELGVAETDIQPSSSFAEDLGADSLDLVELLIAMEEEFGIGISDEDAEKLVTVQDAIDYLEARKTR